MELSELIPEAAIAVRANPAVAGRLGQLPASPQCSGKRAYDLDVVGESIWLHICRQPITLAELRNAIQAEFAVQSERCDRDIRAWLQQMEAEGLIDIDLLTVT
ncbi:MAG: PqqD family peptide modification chaperone [Cyanobacteria bacterium P01_F01_bin.33]